MLLAKQEALAADDLPFQHYSLRHRAIAWISRRLFDRFTYTVRHGLVRGMQRRGGLGWTPAWLSRETEEEMFWHNLPLDGLVVYDVGAFHGILTLFFASHCAHVIAYEPNDMNCARLSENIYLNNLINVQVRKVGVGSQPRPARCIMIQRWRVADLSTRMHPRRFRSSSRSRRSISTLLSLPCPRPI